MTIPKSSLSTAIQARQAPRLLEMNDPIAKKLFRPFIQADFVAKGRVNNHTQISLDEHKWLIEHALMFNLDPEKDLNIPSISTRDNDEPLDTRLATSIAKFEIKRAEKEERKKAREEKQLLRQLQDGKITEDDIEEKEPYAKDYLPLRLRTRRERDLYNDSKREFVQSQLLKMDDIVRKWREKRRSGLLALKKSKKEL